MLTNMTLLRNKTNIPLTVDHTLTRQSLRPMSSAQPSLNYYFDSKVLILKPKANRLFYIDSKFYSESEVVSKYVVANEIFYLVMKPAFKDVVTVDVIETNLIKNKIGTYTIPNVVFSSALFKPNTSYLYIKNGVLGIANSFADITVANTDVISLFESNFVLTSILNTAIPSLPIKDTSYFDLLLNEVTPNVKYFPFVYNNLGKTIFSIQNPTDKIYPSLLKTYADFLILDTFSEFDTDVYLNKTIPDSVVLNSADTDPQLYTKLLSTKTFNSNFIFNNQFKNKALVKLDLKMMTIREVDGSLKYYYGQPFKPDMIFFYNGRLFDNFKLVNLKTGINGIDGQVELSMNFNYALFSLDIIPNKMYSIAPNSCSTYTYEVNESGVFSFSDEVVYDHEDRLRIYSMHKNLAYRKTTNNDIGYLATLTKDNLVIFDKNCLYELPSNFDIAANIILDYFTLDNLLNISIPDSTCVIANRTATLMDITSTQDSGLLDRGIIIVPESYHLLFINGRLVNTNNYTKLFNDYKIIDTSFYNNKITSVKVYIDTEYLYGRYNYQNFLATIAINKSAAMIQYYKDIYSIRATDGTYSGDNTVFVASDNLKGNYDRLYNFLLSDVMDALLSLPEGDPKLDIGLAMIKRSFSDITSSVLGFGAGDKICLPCGGPAFRHNIFE